MITPFLPGQFPPYATAFLGRQPQGAIAASKCLARRDTIGAIAEIDTISVAAPENSATYVARWTSSTPGQVGVVFSFTAETDSGATAPELITALVAAMQADPNFLGLVSTITTTASTIVVTFKLGQSGTWTFPTNPTTDLSVAVTQAAATFPSYLWGRFVEIVAPVGGPSILVSEGVRPINAAAATGPVLTTTMTYSSTGNASMNLLYKAPGSTVFVPVTLGWAMGANLAASVTNLAAEWELEIPASSSTTSTGVVVATLPVGAEVQLVSETTASGTVSTVVGAAPLRAPLALVYDDGRAPIVDGYPVAAQPTGPIIGSAVPTVTDGYWTVEYPGVAVTLGAPVWVEETVGANLGRPYTTGSATRRLHPTAKWVRQDPQNALYAHIDLGA